MSPATATQLRAYLLFTGTGPILVLTTYPDLADPGLVGKLALKGITRFMAYEVTLDAARDRYRDAFESVSADLEGSEDIRVLDFNGHQIMANFSLEELGSPIKVG